MTAAAGRRGGGEVPGAAARSTLPWLPPPGSSQSSALGNLRASGDAALTLCGDGGFRGAPRSSPLPTWDLGAGSGTLRDRPRASQPLLAAAMAGT